MEGGQLDNCWFVHRQYSGEGVERGGQFWMLQLEYSTPIITMTLLIVIIITIVIIIIIIVIIIMELYVYFNDFESLSQLVYLWELIEDCELERYDECF